MRKSGTFENVYFKLQGWCIKNLAYKYRVFKDDEHAVIYAHDYKDLKRKIANLLLESYS